MWQAHTHTRKELVSFGAPTLENFGCGLKDFLQKTSEQRSEQVMQAEEKGIHPAERMWPLGCLNCSACYVNCLDGVRAVEFSATLPPPVAGGGADRPVPQKLKGGPS